MKHNSSTGALKSRTLLTILYMFRAGSLGDKRKSPTII